MFENVKGGFYNNQFIHVQNHRSSDSPREDATVSRLLDSIKKDSHLNGYTAGSPTIRVPRFTFDTISCLLGTSPLHPSSALAHPTYGSCAFDLAQSLRLLPEQEYGMLLATVEIDVDKVGRHNDRYCGYISRHGLVLLADCYARRVSLTAGSIIIDTSIGRFKVFKHDHRTYAHFDGSMRATALPRPNISPLLNTDVLDFPELSVIQKYADWSYPVQDLFAATPIPKDQTTWKRFFFSSETRVSKFALAHVVQPAPCPFFLPHKTVQHWETLRKFSKDLLRSVADVFMGIKAPERLCQIRDIHAQGIKHSALFNPMDISVSVAQWGSICRVTSNRLDVISRRKPDETRQLTLETMACLCQGYSQYRSAASDVQRLAETSDKRFQSLFEIYKARPDSPDLLEEELHKLLHKSENICLVLWQGVLASLVYWNSCKVLESAIESPEEWIQFVLAQDSDVLVG